MKDGRNFLFAHSETERRWFISELSTSWDGNAEIVNGNWKRFFNPALNFEEGGHNYMLGHSEEDNKIFVSQIYVALDVD